MATKAEVTAMFETFIASEEKALARKKQGDWYCMNWADLKRHLNKAPALLPADRLERLYVHLLRLGILPNREQVGAHYAVLERAYRIHTQYMPTTVPSGPASMLSRFDGLLLFGYDYRSAVAVNAGLEDYLRYREALTQFNKYAHIPGMLKKAAGMASFADDPAVVERICLVMRTLEFIQDDYHQPGRDDEDYDYLKLPFWAAIFTLMLSRFDQAVDTVASFRAREDLPAREDHMELFARFELQASRAGT